MNTESYKGQNELAEFECRLHGCFERKVILALSKKDPCPNCADAMRDNFPSSAEALELMIKRALGKDYTVEPFEYFGRRTKVRIHCSYKNHPSFTQTVRSIDHLQGCPICRKVSVALKRRQSVAMAYSAKRSEYFHAWLDAARDAYGDKFDYSEVDYRSARQKVKIGCPVHGVILQTPANHLVGGCRQCADEDLKGRYSESYFLKHPKAGKQPATLYYLRFNYRGTEFFKVGITIRNVATRHAMLNTLPELKSTTLAEASMSLEDAFNAEQAIQFEHGRYSRLELPFGREVQRKIRIGPSECFAKPVPDDLLFKYLMRDG